jgi:hypothetical protein
MLLNLPLQKMNFDIQFETLQAHNSSSNPSIIHKAMKRNAPVWWDQDNLGVWKFGVGGKG